jgi:hypothetical protein
MRRAALVAVLLLTACRIEKAPSGRPPGPITAADTLRQIEEDSISAARVEAAVRAYYASLDARDWPVVREGFWPGATITSRAVEGRRASPLAVLTVDEYLRQTLNGKDRLPSGILVERAHVSSYAEFAAAWVVWRTVAPRRRAAATVRGLDAFHFARRGGQWRIVSILTTRESPDQPLVVTQP